MSSRLAIEIYNLAEASIQRLAQQWVATPGIDFNINSPKKLGESNSNKMLLS